MHVMKMCSAFAKQGERVTLICLKGDEAIAKVDLWEYYGVSNDFDIIRLPSMESIRGRRYILGFFAAIYAKIHKADLCYGRDPFACRWSSWLGIRTFFEAHRFVRLEDKSTAALNSLFSSRSFKGVSVITQPLRSHICEQFTMSRDLVEVFSDGADPCHLERIVVSRSGAQTARKLKLGYAGSLHEGKGMDLIAELVTRSANFELVVIGGNDSQVEHWLEVLRNYRDRVHFWGHVAHAEVANLLLDCDVLIAPYSSVVKHTGQDDIAGCLSPLKIFEYMALGKAILCARLPVLNEILKDRRNCILANPDDVDDWLDKIAILENEALRDQLGSIAKADLESKYSWDARSKNILSWICKLIV